MKLMGWKFTGVDADVQEEYPVEGMAGVIGRWAIVIMSYLVKMVGLWQSWRPSEPAKTQTLDASRRCCMRIAWSVNLAADQ